MPATFTDPTHRARPGRNVPGKKGTPRRGLPGVRRRVRQCVPRNPCSSRVVPPLMQGRDSSGFACLPLRPPNSSTVHGFSGRVGNSFWARAIQVANCAVPHAVVRAAGWPPWRRIDAGRTAKPQTSQGPIMLVVTTENVPGYSVREVKGQVFGVVVRSRGLGGNIMAGLRSLVGGEIPEYTQLLEEARRHAVDRMVKNANLMHANAVVMMRFDSAEIGQTMSEIVAYGTAVVLEKAA